MLNFFLFCFCSSGELPCDFPEADCSGNLYEIFSSLSRKQIFVYFALRGEVDQNISVTHKLVPGLLLRCLVLSTGGDYFSLGRFRPKRTKKVILFIQFNLF